MPRTVLIADDSPTIQRRASGILTGEGWEVVTVSNGVAAIKKLPSLKPLVALADVSMPGRDGYEVCQFIKQSPELKHVPVALIFSDDDPYEEGRAAQAGADGRIRKPFDAEELVKIVNRLAERAEAEAVARPVAPPAPRVAELHAPEAAFQEPPEAPPVSEANAAPVPEGIAFDQFVTEESAESPLQEPASAAELELELGPAPAGFEEPFAPPVAETESAPIVSPEPAASVEPELVEGISEAAEIEHEAEHVHPHADEHAHPTFFHAPEEIAEPVLSDAEELSVAEPSLTDSEPQAAEVAPPASQPVPSLTPEAVEAIDETPMIPPETAVPRPLEIETAEQPEPVAAETPPEAPAEGDRALEPPAMVPSTPEAAEAGSSSPLDSPPAAAAELPAESAPSIEPQEAATAASPTPLDADQILAVVRRVVIKMSPPALPASAIEEVTRRIADEVIAEMKP